MLQFVSALSGGVRDARKESVGACISFHDCRHTFASMCAMQGIDFATIASWLGHVDGGTLVAKVYSHLAPGHMREAAQRLCLEAVIIDGNVKAA